MNKANLNFKEKRKFEVMEPNVKIQPETYIYLMIPYNKRQSTSLLFENSTTNYYEQMLPETHEIHEKNINNCIQSINEEISVRGDPDAKNFHCYDPQKMRQISNTKRGEWTPEEKIQFERGLKALGKNWTAISKHFVTTRTRRQVGVYAKSVLIEKN
eukprot:gene6103-10110_t